MLLTHYSVCLPSSLSSRLFTLLLFFSQMVFLGAEQTVVLEYFMDEESEDIEVEKARG